MGWVHNRSLAGAEAIHAIYLAYIHGRQAQNSNASEASSNNSLHENRIHEWAEYIWTSINTINYMRGLNAPVSSTLFDNVALIRAGIFIHCFMVSSSRGHSPVPALDAFPK